MTTNPILKKLGYPDDARLVIVHVDDVGMCQSSVQAFAELWELGTVSSGAVMVPCPWFQATVDWARRHPEVDLGVHGTVNAEWAGYRWGPISTRDPATGLLDDEGYFHHDTEDVWQQADPAAVQAEIAAQVERALAVGLDITHIDSHMGTILHPKFMPGYLENLRRFRRPGLLPRLPEGELIKMGTPIDDGNVHYFGELFRQLDAEGFPMIDAIADLPLDDPHDHIGLTKERLNALSPGITHFLMHPAVDTPELRAMTPDWPSRVANYEAFRSREIRDFLRNGDFHVIGYRPLRDLLAGPA